MLDAMVRHIKENGDNIHRLSLYRGGIWQHASVRDTCPCQNCYSVTKSFTATLVGMAADEGLLSLDQPILDFFAGRIPSEADEKLAQVTVRHLLTHTMGNATGYMFEADRHTHGTNDWVRFILSQPLAHRPGVRFQYSNSVYYLLGCIVHAASGQTMERYAQRKLFAPLGILDYAWTACPMGETSGATGLYLSTADMAKLGQLYLQRGMWAGHQIVSQAFVAAATSDQVREERPIRYGLGFWLHKDGFSATGSHSQIVLVLPGRQTILAGHGYQDQFDYRKLYDQCKKPEPHKR